MVSVTDAMDIGPVARCLFAMATLVLAVVVVMYTMVVIRSVRLAGNSAFVPVGGTAT